MDGWMAGWLGSGRLVTAGEGGGVRLLLLLQTLETSESVKPLEPLTGTAAPRSDRAQVSRAPMRLQGSHPAEGKYLSAPLEPLALAGVRFLFAGVWRCVDQ